MFNWFKKNKIEENKHENCHKQQTVTDKSFKMIRGTIKENMIKPRVTISEIYNLLGNLKDLSGDIAFYIESKCKHGVIYNNRIFIYPENNKQIKIEIQRPQDLCFCISHVKAIKYNEFEKCFEDVSLLISCPQARGFVIEEWS